MANNVLEYILRVKDEATKTIQGFGKTLDKSTVGLTQFGKEAIKTGAMISASAIPLALYGKSAFDLATDVESAWARVAKVYDGTADSIDNELIPASKRLSIELGQNKLEVIAVMEELSAMGEKGPELIEKTTQAIDFQALSGLELDEALQTVVATSAIWGVEGEELTKMLAAMNQAENQGVASMGDLGEAMATVGNVAKVSGVDVKELNSMMSVLRKRSVEAGEGANALKTIFTRLRSPSEEANEIMQKYGISIFETKNQVGEFTKVIGSNAEEVERLQKKITSKTNSLKNYEAGISGAGLSAEALKDKQASLRSEIESATVALNQASGQVVKYNANHEVVTDTLKDADAILIDVAKSWRDMTDAEREELSFSLGTMYQKDKFLALMDDLNSENSEYNKILQGQADDIANLTAYEKELAIARETNAFKLAQANAKFAEMKEVIGSTLLIALTPFITKLSELALKFSELSPNVQTAITGIGLFVVVLGPLLMGIGSISLGISALISVFGAFSTLLAGVALGPIALAVGAFAGFAIAILNLSGHMEGLRFKTSQLREEEQRLADQRVALENSIKNQEQLDIRLEQAVLNAETATKQLNGKEKELAEARIKYGEQSEQYKQKEDELTQAEINAKQSQIYLKQAQDDVQAGRDEIITQADQLAETEEKVVTKANEISRASFSNLYGTMGLVLGTIEKLISKWKDWRALKAGENEGSGGGARAEGGPVKSGSTYLVGEEGPELFTPRMNGNIIPNDKLRDSSSNANVSNQSVVVNAVVNTPIDLVNLGNMLGQQLAFAGR